MSATPRRLRGQHLQLVRDADRRAAMTTGTRAVVASTAQSLGERLDHLELDDPIVLAVAYGGTRLGRQVAARLGLTIDSIPVRRLHPVSHPEITLGMLGEDGVRVLTETAARDDGMTGVELAAAEAVARRALRRCDPTRRHHLDLTGRDAIVVDGHPDVVRALVAGRVARRRGAAYVVLAVPEVQPEWADALATSFDQVVSVADQSPQGGSCAPAEA